MDNSIIIGAAGLMMVLGPVMVFILKPKKSYSYLDGMIFYGEQQEKMGKNKKGGR